MTSFDTNMDTNRLALLPLVAPEVPGASYQPPPLEVDQWLYVITLGWFVQRLEHAVAQVQPRGSHRLSH